MLVTINDEGADLWVVMRGNKTAIGRLSEQYRPAHIGVRCSHPDQISLVKDWIKTLHEDGYWERTRAKDPKRVVNIKLSEVRARISELDLK